MVRPASRLADGASGVTVKIRRKVRSEWLALMPNAHEGYVSWEKAEAILRMVSDNIPTSRHHGAPKHGDALLGRACPLPALRPQADASLLRHAAQYPALQLQPRLARQRRAASSPSEASGSMMRSKRSF